MASKPSLVYIPGMALDGSEFLPAAKFISAAGYPYRCVQRPGVATGEPPLWDEGFCLERERDRVRQVLTPGCVVVAHSFGGFLVPRDERIHAIIYLDSSLPGKQQWLAPGVLWPLTRPLARAIWPFSKWFATVLYEDAAYNRGALQAQRDTHQCARLVITAGTTGYWYREQRVFAQEIGAKQVAISGCHLLARQRPEAVAAQALKLLAHSEAVTVGENTDSSHSSRAVRESTSGN